MGDLAHAAGSIENSILVANEASSMVILAQGMFEELGEKKSKKSRRLKYFCLHYDAHLQKLPPHAADFAAKSRCGAATSPEACLPNTAILDLLLDRRQLTLPDWLI